MKRSTTGFMDVPGSRLYYEVAGTGPPLVLVHGGGVDSRMWDDQFETLADRWQVLRYDLRGHGRSPVGVQEYSAIEDLNELRAGLGIGSAYILGQSLGGNIAMAFAVVHPERVDALILAGSGGAPGISMADDEKRPIAAFFEALQGGDCARAIELFLSLWVDGIDRQAASHVRERVVAMLNEHTWPQFSPGFPGERWPERASLDHVAEIQAPVLFIVGEHDQRIFHRAADMCLTRLGDARKVVIQGAAHFANMDRPEAFNQAVLDFLRSDNIPTDNRIEERGQNP
jgi:pimeloyl-ACP methyl ester carboxylesterase